MSNSPAVPALESLATHSLLGSLLDELNRSLGGYKPLDHWQQGEYDLVLEARTPHWFNPCELLLPTARSELRPEFREREVGGGWRMKSCAVERNPKPPGSS